LAAKPPSAFSRLLGDEPTEPCLGKPRHDRKPERLPFVTFLASQKSRTAKFYLAAKAPLIAKPDLAMKLLLAAKHYPIVKVPVVMLLCRGCEGALFSEP